MNIIICYEKHSWSIESAVPWFEDMPVIVGKLTVNTQQPIGQAIITWLNIKSHILLPSKNSRGNFSIESNIRSKGRLIKGREVNWGNTKHHARNMPKTKQPPKTSLQAASLDSRLESHEQRVACQRAWLCHLKKRKDRTSCLPRLCLFSRSVMALPALLVKVFLSVLLTADRLSDRDSLWMNDLCCSCFFELIGYWTSWSFMIFSLFMFDVLKCSFN